MHFLHISVRSFLVDANSCVLLHCQTARLRGKAKWIDEPSYVCICQFWTSSAYTLLLSV